MYYDDGETQWTGTAPGTAVTFSVRNRSLTSEVNPGNEKIARVLDEVVILGVNWRPAEVNFMGRDLNLSYDMTTNALVLSSLSFDLNYPIALSWA